MIRFLSVVVLLFMASSIFCQGKFSRSDIKDRVETIQKLISQNNYEKAFELFFSMDKIVDKDGVPKRVEEEYNTLNKTLNKKRTLFENNRIKVQNYVSKYNSGEYCSALWLLNLEINKQTAYAKTIELFENYHDKIQGNKEGCEENKTKIEEVTKLIVSKKYFIAKEKINSINSNYLYVQDQETFEKNSKRIGDKEYDYEEVKGYIIDDPKSILANLADDRIIYSDAQDLIDQLEYIEFKAPILISNLDGDYKDKVEIDYNAFLPILLDGILELKSFLKNNPPPYGEEVAKYVKDGFFQIYNPKYKAYYDPHSDCYNIDANCRFDKKVMSAKRLEEIDLLKYAWPVTEGLYGYKLGVETKRSANPEIKTVFDLIYFEGSDLDRYKYEKTEEYAGYKKYVNYLQASIDTGLYVIRGYLSFYDVQKRVFYLNFIDINEALLDVKNLLYDEPYFVNKFYIPSSIINAEKIEDTWVEPKFDSESGFFTVQPYAIIKYYKGTKKIKYLRISLFDTRTKKELVTVIFDKPYEQIKSTTNHTGKIIDFSNFTETTADDYIKTTSSKTPVSFNISEPDIQIDEKIEEESISSVHGLDLSEIQTPPMFPGGEEGLYRYIAENFEWPSKDIEEGNQGRVFVQFVVNENGEIENVKVARGINPRLNAEAVRVIKSMPRWSPGYIDGEAVKVRYMMPIVLKLKDNELDSVGPMVSLKMAGWEWDKPPRENRIMHSGQIVFKFFVDVFGEVEGIQIISSSFTPEEEKWLKECLASTKFRQTSSGRPPELTEGSLVWKFRAR